MTCIVLSKLFRSSSLSCIKRNAQDLHNISGSQRRIISVMSHKTETLALLTGRKRARKRVRTRSTALGRKRALVSPWVCPFSNTGMHFVDYTLAGNGSEQQRYRSQKCGGPQSGGLQLGYQLWILGTSNLTEHLPSWGPDSEG